MPSEIFVRMIKMIRSRKQMSETYLIGSILALVGGYFDAYTYIARNHVFANAQTGNIVLLGINLFSGDFTKALSYFLPVFAFFAGVLVCEVFKRYRRHLPFHWRQYVIFLELAVTVIVAFLPQGRVSGINCDLIANISISFVCSLQVQSFRKIRGINCATTMCTGNLRSGTDCLMAYFTKKDKQQLHSAGKYYGIVGLFMSGAVLSSYITYVLAEKSVLVCSFGLLAVLLLMFIKPEENKDT